MRPQCVISMLGVVVILMVLSTSPQRHQAQAFVQFAQPPVPVARQLNNNPYDARRINASQMTLDDFMVIICDKLPSNVKQCKGIPAFDSYILQHSARLMGISSGRKRRSFSFPNIWDKSWSSPHNFGSSYWPFSSGKSHYPWQNYNVGTSGNVLICPSQMNQSLPYLLSSDSDDYPAEEIGDELGRIDPEFLAFLMMEVVLTTTPPLVAVEDFQGTAVVTCPFTEQRLWQYQSVMQGQMCWVLANYGDFVLYRECIERFCLDCFDTPYPTGGYNQGGHHQDDYHQGGYHQDDHHQGGYHQDDHHQGGYPPNTLPGNNSLVDRYQKLCITDYRAMSFWAYCPLNPEGDRIVRDRIILPLACGCQNVLCDIVPPTG